MTAAATRRQASNAMPSRASSNGSRDDEEEEDDADDDVFLRGLSSGGPTRLSLCFVFRPALRGGTGGGMKGGAHQKQVLIMSQSAGRKDTARYRKGLSH